MADPEKQFPATPRKRQEAKKKGQVARSMELNSVLILVGVLLTMRLVGPAIYDNLTGMLVKVLSSLDTEVTSLSVVAYAPTVVLQFGKIIAPVLVVCLVFGVTANVVQFGFIFTGEPLIPKLSKVNPVQGFKRLFSKRTVVELVKAIFKIAIVGFVSYLTLKAESKHIFAFMEMENIQIFTYVSAVVFKLFLRICLVLVAIAFIDILYQRWDHEQELKMTRQEMKEELKRTEGDPLVKQRIRTIQRQLSQQRMMAEVPKADVVITNPTELAIAVKYDPEEQGAPQVVAKGSRLVAQKIRELAKEHEVPVVENKPLAQLLYKSVEVGMEIPAKLYQAVAEILAYVYRLKGKV